MIIFDKIQILPIFVPFVSKNPSKSRALQGKTQEHRNSHNPWLIQSLETLKFSTVYQK